MSKETELLAEVASRAEQMRAAEEDLQAQADAWMERNMAPYVRAIDAAVMGALEEHSVMAVARAFTVSGKTPNRNAIYEIAGRNAGAGVDVSSYPFMWQGRVVKTATGNRTVYDLTGIFENFGPDGLTGGFVWRYDTATGELDPVITQEDPYPDKSFYAKALTRWVEEFPYPGEEV